jgi:hypothetical protein
MRISHRRIFLFLPLMFLIGGYLNSYLCLLTPEKCTFCLLSDDGTSMHALVPQFRVQHPAVHTFYSPLLWLDRRIRPTYWCWTEKPERPLSYTSSRGGGFGGSKGTPISYIEVEPNVGPPPEHELDAGTTPVD